MFLAPEDFTAQYKVATGNNYSDADFQLYINKLEQKYLTDLLGVELYNLFAADVVLGTPVTQIYIDIFDEFSEDDGVGSGCQYRSEGMVEMLKGFIYFEWLRNQQTQNVISGVIKNEYSNSIQASLNEANLETNYNESVDTYDTIQWYIKENLTDYPLYNGKAKGKISWL